MVQPMSWWQRVSSVFRPGTAGPAGDFTLSTGAVTPEQAAHPAPPRAAEPPPHALAPWWRRPNRQAQAREIALRMNELAAAMQRHFEQQDQRAAELSASLDRVGGTLAQLAETQRTQTEYLNRIAEHAEAAGKNAAAVGATISRLPESLLAQAEAVRSVARHMEIAQESDTQLMHSLQHFGRAVDTLGSSSTAQVEVLQHLNAAQREQHDAFATLVREQSRRFLIIVVIIGVLAAASIAALLLTLAWRA